MYSSNLKVDCDFRTIELLQMSISLKMCYVIITCNEVFYLEVISGNVCQLSNQATESKLCKRALRWGTFGTSLNI